MPRRSRPFPLPAVPALAFRLAYVAVIVLATATEPAASAVHAWPARLARAIDFTPSGTALVDAARNILLFMGWGVVWVLTARPGPARPQLLRATLSGALLSGLAEAGQLFSPTRTASVVDLATNTAGSLLGAFGAVLLVLAARAGMGRRSYLGLPALLVAASYSVAAFLEACFPIFRQRRIPGAWGPPGERLAMALREFPWTPLEPAPWPDVLLFAPVGILAFAALAELQLSRRRAVTAVLAAAALALAGAELVRGASGYAISWRAFLAHIAGIAVGVAVAARWLGAFSRRARGSGRVRAVLAAYALVYALWVLRPYALQLDPASIAENLTSGHLVPLTSYRQRLDLFTTADVAIPAFLLLPVGGLLAVWPLRARGWLRGVLPAVYLAAVLEIVQLFVAGRWFDVTDILVASAAATVGFVAMRRAGYRPYGTLLGAPDT